MELGNALFGHSRGRYPLRRSKGFEAALDRLFEVCAPNNRVYGEEFANKVFAIFPYYWDDCTCGYDQKEQRWNEENKHEPQCYQSALNREQAEWLANNPEPEAQIRDTSYEEIEDGITLIVSVPAYSPSADTWRKWHADGDQFQDQHQHDHKAGQCES